MLKTALLAADFVDGSWHALPRRAAL